MNIIFSGDMVINKDYDADRLIDKNIIKLFSEADYRIVNFEAPITSSKNAIIKVGPNLKMHEAGLKKVISKLNINFAALANNHIKDYGEEGVLDTIRFCKENNIEGIGAGKDISEASKIKVIKKNGIRVAFVNVAENEWASATKNEAGANGMNIIRETKLIQQAKKNNNFVFVIVHGGHEYYSLPSPRMQEQYRFYVEQGADLVVAHHTHCVSGYEVYKGAPIYYSLGNFLFTKPNDNDVWYEGALLQVSIKEKKIKCSLYPVSMDKQSFGLSLPRNKTTFEQKIRNLNEIIQNPDKLEREWQNYIDEKSKSYLSIWSLLSFIENRYIRGLLRRLPMKFSFIYGWKRSLNFMRCEAHRDLSCAVLQKKLNEK